MAEIRQTLAPGTPVEVWFQDEMRVGQKNKLTYRWARKGSRASTGSRQGQNAGCAASTSLTVLVVRKRSEQTHRRVATLARWRCTVIFPDVAAFPTVGAADAASSRPGQFFNS